jgi:anti-sigma factor ChrR (cupin superfamily)
MITGRRDSAASEAKVAGPIFEELAMAVAARQLPATDRERLRLRMLSRARCTAPADTFTVRACDGAWQPLAPGVTIKVLRTDPVARNQTLLVRMTAGSVIESHRHTQPEECFVVEGEIRIGNHRLSAGDLHVASAGSSHAPIHSRSGALLLVRAEMLCHA